MSIQSEITRIAQNVSDSFDAVAAKGGTRPQAQNSSNLPDAILSIPAAGVQSFNGRTGDVEPQEGDYSAEMVGAQPTINVSGILKGNGNGGVSAAVAGTDFAPGGFGLGGVSTPLIQALTGDTNLNDVVLNGWYQWSDPAPQNAPQTYCVMRVWSGLGSYTVQECKYGGTIALTQIRTRNGQNWSPWEWVNPPMQVGVEYRTTERYMGKPVYVKVVDCGALPEINTYKSVQYSSTNVLCVSCSISIPSSYGYGGIGGYDTTLSGNSFTANARNVYIKSYASPPEGQTVYATVKYIKTTD